MSPTAKKALITFGIILSVTVMAVMGVMKTRAPKPVSGQAWEGTTQDLGDGPAIGGAFELIDQDGKVRTEKDFLGRPTLVYFGYTFCPDICPMALGNISELLHEVGPDKLNVAFITIDPDRDTVAQLKNYSQNFDPSIVMLSGSPEKIKEATNVYHVYAAKVKEPGMTDYVMDHSSIIYVMDKDGKYVKSFNHQSSAGEMKAGLKEIVQ